MSNFGVYNDVVDDRSLLALSTKIFDELILSSVFRIFLISSSIGWLIANPILEKNKTIKKNLINFKSNITKGSSNKQAKLN